MAKNYVPELLAPAGSIDALKTAVNAGADAVYISGKKFGARKFATNFTDAEIEEGLIYAKLRGVKVYVTVNTLIKDFQINAVAKYLIWLYKTGADAVIIQDLGIACLANKIVPDLDMHASTQMTIHNIPGVEWASKFGFKRVVLSRELGISEVEEIRKETADLGIEIEIFGHGALCYSYSGQCLLSSFIGGRSGNKGMCAQPCRKQYTLIGGMIDQYGKPIDIHPIDLKDEYLLSTRDLAVYENLNQIASSNVNSLKIEGRMKSAEYVAIVVKVYREALDSISKGNWKPNLKDISLLKLAFNRGFTGGYLKETREMSVMGREAPGNRGLYIGQVQNFNAKNNTAIINVFNKFKLEKGDGIVFLSPHENENKFKEGYRKQGPNTYRLSNKKFAPYGTALEIQPEYKRDKLVLKIEKPVKSGSKVYLTRSIYLNHYAKYIIKNNIEPSIPINVVMRWDDNLKAHLEGEFIGFDGQKYSIHLKSDFKMEKAIKKPLKKDQIENQLQKTGHTPFILNKVSIKYPGDLFLPISKLNQFRREFLEKSELKLLETYKPSEFEVQMAENYYKNIEKSFSPIKLDEEDENKINKPDIVLAVYADSFDTVKGALDGGAKRIYYEPFITHDDICNCSKSPESLSKSLQDVDQEEIDILTSLLVRAEQLCKAHNADFIWKWPQITPQYQINNYHKILKTLSNGFQEVMVDGVGAAEGIKEISPHLTLSGSAGLNIWNTKTILTLSKIFNILTPSAELSKKDLSAIIRISHLNGIKNRFELVVQGNVDTLISKDCLLSIVPENDIAYKYKFWGIKDVKNRIFPVKIDSDGHTHILNSVELCLVDYLPEISQIGVEGIVVDLRTKTYDYAKDMTSIYTKGLEYVGRGVNTGKNMNKLKSRIKNLSTGGITTGNFLKGISGE